MTKQEEIKNRIGLINRGEVPDGYKKENGYIVPQDWNSYLFLDIFKERIEKTSDISKYPLYSLTIEQGVVPKTEQYERSFLIKKDTDSYKVVLQNDYVMNPMNLRFGAIAMHKKSCKCTVSGYYNIFSLVNNFNHYYIESFLKSSKMISYYNRMATGSLIEKQRVHFSQFENFKFSFPKEDEQKKIAEILNCCDKVIELKQKLLDEKYKQKKWLLKIIISKSNDAKKTKLGNISELITKGTTPSYFVQKSNIKFVKIESISNGIIQNSQCSYISEDIHNKDLARSVLKEDDILFGIAGALGVCAKVKKENLPANTNQALAIIRLKNNILPDLLVEILKSSIMKKYIYMNNTGCAQQNLNLEQIKNFTFCLPELNKQKHYVKILSIINKELELLEQELNEYKTLKKSLSRLLLTGIVRVNEV